MLTSPVVATWCNKLMENICQPIRNTALYQRRWNLKSSVPVSGTAASFLQSSAAVKNSENTTPRIIRMILAPDKTMVPDETVPTIRPPKLYDDIDGDNPDFPRTNIPRPGNAPKSADGQDSGYEPEPDLDGKIPSLVSASHPVAVRVLRGSLQNKAASDLNAASVTKSPQTRAQSLAHIKFLIAIADRRTNFLDSNQEALGKFMNKSGMALIGLKNSCEQTYKDVYSKHFDISYKQEIDGHKHHAEILRSAHIYADQIAQARLLSSDDEAKAYGKFWSQFELSFDAICVPTKHSLKTNEPAVWGMTPIPAIATVETKL